MSTISGTVRISRDLFFKVYEFFTFDIELEPHEIEAIKKELDEKWCSMYKRYLFAKYKNKELTPAEREKAKREYLEFIGRC